MEYPPWLDRNAYPFAPHFLEVEGGRMHYIDEGTGPPVVFVHGTPAWSFLYRHLVKDLAQGYRCIAMDHIGFGLSDKPVGWSYRPDDHARNLRALIEHLGLRDITLVVHDFGGAIGLSYAVERPENVVRVVLFNTWMWSFDDVPQVRQSVRLMGGSFGQFLYTRLNFSPRTLLRLVWGNRRTLTPALHHHYSRVHPTPAERLGMWALVRELVASGPWWDSLWARRERIQDLPALLLWGMKDPTTRPEALPRWQALFTQATTITFPGAGHFVQEEEAAAVVAHVREFLDRRPARRRAVSA